MNIRFPYCLSPPVSPKRLPNCLDQPKLNFQRNSPSECPPRVLDLFILFRAIILSRGIFRFAATRPARRREPADVGWYYRTLWDNCQQIGDTKNRTISLKLFGREKKSQQPTWEQLLKRFKCFLKPTRILAALGFNVRMRILAKNDFFLPVSYDVAQSGNCWWCDN